MANINLIIGVPIIENNFLYAKHFRQFSSTDFINFHNAQTLVSILAATVFGDFLSAVFIYSIFSRR